MFYDDCRPSHYFPTAGKTKREFRLISELAHRSYRQQNFTEGTVLRMSYLSTLVLVAVTRELIMSVVGIFFNLLLLFRLKKMHTTFYEVRLCPSSSALQSSTFWRLVFTESVNHAFFNNLLSNDYWFESISFKICNTILEFLFLISSPRS